MDSIVFLEDLGLALTLVGFLALAGVVGALVALAVRNRRR